MTKGKSTWKYNKLLTARRNYFSNGDQMYTSPEDHRKFLIPPPFLPNANLIQEPKAPELLKVPLTPIKNTENSFLGLDWSNPFKGEKGNEFKNAAVSAVGTAVGNTAQGLLSGGKTSGAGNVLSGLSNIASAIPGPWGTVASAGFKLFSGAANALLGSKINEANVAKVKENINNLKGFQSNASDWDNLAQNWANAATGMNFSNKFIGSDGLFSNKASNLANSLRNNISLGEDWVERSLANNAENIDTNTMNNLNANYGAYGGELATNGSLFTNGLLYINNGGSHESNPHEGVQLGVDPEGTPNLVEEGETVFNDFVFSKRLMVPKAFRKKYKMGGLKDISFAEMSKRMAKESEERPNDPISLRGLQAMMRDLAMTQEALKEAQRPNQYAYGGNIFATKGKMNRGNQTLNYNNSTTGLYFGLDKDKFNPYNDDGTINWGIMYNTDSPYTKRRQYVLDNWDTPGVQAWLDKYVEGINKYNENRKGYQQMTKDDITKDLFSKRTWDKSWGGMHAGIDYAGDPEKKIIEKHMLRNPDGAPTEMPKDAIYYSGIDDKTGYTWDDRFKNEYKRAYNGEYKETTDKEGNKIRTYYYDPVKKSTKKNNYYFGEDDNWTEQTGDNPILDIMNKGNYRQVKSAPNNSGGNDYFYSLEKEKKMPKPLPTDWRYAPILGLAGAAISDAFGLTNKPDYSNANAILEASRGAGTYQPVAYQPVGNKLPEVIFDRDNYINKLNAQTGATLRNIMNTAGGNRGTALASIIAADNNALNNIGDLAIKGNEYNWNNLIKKEDFNRGTNSANSTGFLQAATANQQALMNSRQLGLKGAMTAYEMMNNARLAADAAKSANLSKLFTSIGNIGRENMAWNWRNFGIATDSFGHVGDGEQTELLTHYNTAAKGGKLKKKKKGLTI